MRFGSTHSIQAQKERAQNHARKLALQRTAAASRDSDGTAEIPRLENVGFAVMRKQFGEEELEIKRGVLALEYFVDDGIGYSYDVNFDVSEVFSSKAVVNSAMRFHALRRVGGRKGTCHLMVRSYRDESIGHEQRIGTGREALVIPKVHQRMKKSQVLERFPWTQCDGWFSERNLR